MKAPILNSVYITVSNMEKSIALYELIFWQEVDIYDDNMSVFELENISFLLSKYQKKDNIVFGNNTVINIEVENVEHMLNFCKSHKLEIVMPLQKIENFHIFQIKDYDWNVIEFYEAK